MKQLRDGMIVETVERAQSPVRLQERLLKLRLKRERLRNKIRAHQVYDAELASDEQGLIAILEEVGLQPAVPSEPPVAYDVPDVAAKVPSEHLGRRGRVVPPTLEKMRRP